jgi:hypothetical protein
MGTFPSIGKHGDNIPTNQNVMLVTSENVRLSKFGFKLRTKNRNPNIFLETITSGIHELQFTHTA